MSGFAQSVLDTAGTWAGVALAAIALVGIVTSWIVLRELHSEKTNALNYLHDDGNPPFISRGLPFGRRTRIFRRIRVPDLTPYDAWAAGDRFVVPKTGESWILGRLESPSCRTGWARLCRLLGAYEFDQDQMKLGTRGDLLFEDGETWLPVSRYWILSMGLLGRYGDRADGGVHFEFAGRMIQPDLREQLICIQPPASPSNLRHGTGQPILSRPSAPTQMWGTTGSFQMALPPESGRQSIRNRDRLRFKLHIKDQIGPPPGSNGTRLACDEKLPFMFWLAVGFLPYNIGGSKRIASLDVSVSLEREWVAKRANSFFPAGPGAYHVKYWQTYEYGGYNCPSQSLEEDGHALGVDFTLVTCPQNTTKAYLQDPTGAEITHIAQCAQQSLPEGSRRWLCIPRLVRTSEQFVHLFRRVDLQSLADSLLSITWQPWSYLVWKEETNLLYWLVDSVPEFFDEASNLHISPDAEKIGPDHCAQLSEALRSSVHGARVFLDRGMYPNTYDQQQIAHLLDLVDIAKESFPDGDHLRRVVGILYMTVRSFRELVHTLLKARTLESSSIVARLDNSSKELAWLFDYPGFYENRSGDNHSESDDDEPDPEQMVWVRLRAGACDGYPNSSLTKKYPLSAVVRGDGLGKVRVLRMKRKDAEKNRLQELAFYAPIWKQANRRDGSDEKVVEVEIIGDEDDDLVDPEKEVKVQIMGDEDDFPALKNYGISRILKKRERDMPDHGLVVMKYKNAMDLLSENDEKTKAADAFRSLRAMSRNSDDYSPGATAGNVFQIDVPFDGNILAEAVADLTKDQVVLACLWAVTKCALWSKSLDSGPLMNMVHQLSDVVLVS